VQFKVIERGQRLGDGDGDGNGDGRMSEGALFTY